MVYGVPIQPSATITAALAAMTTTAKPAITATLANLASTAKPAATATLASSTTFTWPRVTPSTTSTQSASVRYCGFDDTLPAVFYEGLYVGIFLMGFLNFFILYWAYNHREGTFTPELIKEDAVRKALDTASRVFHESDMPSALLLRNHLQALLKYFEPFRYLSNTVIAETEGLLTNVFTSFSAVVEQLDRTPNRLRNQITELADLLPQLVEQTLQADTLRQQIVDMGFAHDAELQERDNATTLLQWHLARADIDREQAAKASQLFSEDQDERERVMTQMQRLLEIHERSRAEQERSDREPAEGDGVNRDFIGKPAQNPSGGESEPASTNDLAPVENDAVQDGEVDSISGEPANGEEANIKTSKKRHRRKRKAPTSKVHLPAQDNA